MNSPSQFTSYVKILSSLLGLDLYHFKLKVGMKVVLELQKLFQTRKDVKNLYLIALEETLVDHEIIRHQIIVLK